MKRKKQKILSAVAALVLLPFIFWYAAVPDSAIPGLISTRAANLGVDVRVNNFRKGPLLSFSADSIIASYGGRQAFDLEGVRGRINPLGLLGLRLLVPFKAVLARGSVRGRYAYGLFSGRSALAAKLENVQLGDLPHLPLIKGYAGSLGASLEYAEGPRGGAAGSLIFSAKDLRNVPYGFRTANGVIDIAPGTLRIKSISLDSADMYAKLKGRIEKGVYDMRLEMTSAGGTGDPLLRPYMISPGYYVIPFSGRLLQLP
ncbi:MAG: type II secretion system protein GspN [Nitrospiraceae bacterium]|nr:type II secretion system protein GspN [Nitrospiraceae bacterium]